MKLTQKLAIAGTAAIGALAFAGAALAADLPARTYTKAPMMSPVFSWTGFYVGGHVGAGWGTTTSELDVGRTLANNGLDPADAALALVLPIAQTQMNGFLGGVQAGYNWQSGLMVFGIEGDFSGADIKGNAPCLLILNCGSKVDWTADITGRLGVTVGERGLLYVKGGAAWINRKFSVGNGASLSFPDGNGDTIVMSGGVNGSVTNTRLGALLGAGIEYSVTNNWSVKLEYDYMDFESQNVNVPMVAAGSVDHIGGGKGPTFNIANGSFPFLANVNLKDQVHTVKVGANYHF